MRMKLAAGWNLQLDIDKTTRPLADDLARKVPRLKRDGVMAFASEEDGRLQPRHLIRRLLGRDLL
jgi:hypothetical protein